MEKCGHSNGIGNANANADADADADANARVCANFAGKLRANLAARFSLV